VPVGGEDGQVNSSNGEDSQVETSDEAGRQVERQVEPFGKAMRDALKDHAARDAIRKVHLRGKDIEPLTAVVSTLTPLDGGSRDSSVESIVLEGEVIPEYLFRYSILGPPTNSVDGSDFFSLHRFPKLRVLSLSGRFTISSWAWACLKSNTGGLVDLSLSLNSPYSTLTTPQILSLLASNPNIRSLALTLWKIGDDGVSGSKSLVPLRHLEKLSLEGEYRRTSSIMHRLGLPEKVDRTRLGFYNCEQDEVREVVTPHIRDYLRRDPRFKDRLGVVISRYGNRLLLRASVIGVGYHGPDRLPQQGPPFVTLSMKGDDPDRSDVCVDILTFLPQESIVYFETNISEAATNEMVAAMPNLEALYLVEPMVSDGFLLSNDIGPNPHAKLLPPLRRLYLHGAKSESCGSGWSPLVHYVTHQTSINRAFSPYLYGNDINISPGLVGQIEDLVEEFVCGPVPGRSRLYYNDEMYSYAGD